jgi:cytochrome c-type protein NapB
MSFYEKTCLMIVLALISVFAISSVYAETDEISEEELGIRKETLYDENKTTPVYGEPLKKEAGESTRIERAFENSPPLIPHDITRMLPIAQTDNICMGCHMPEESESSGATPIPKSHLFDLSTGKDLKGELDGKRFNCMQCHVIQTTVSPAIENLFKGEFRDEDARYRSNLIDILNEGIE